MLMGLAATFVAGIYSHVLYQRWNPPSADMATASSARQGVPLTDFPGNQAHSVRFAPLTPPVRQNVVNLPVLVARDIEQIRSLAGQQARIRGRVFRVGYSAKSNTYFLNFGPSREALTAVIFASSVELFEKSQQSPKIFENKDVEMKGEIRDHPQYGLEMVLDHPNQIKILN